MARTSTSSPERKTDQLCAELRAEIFSGLLLPGDPLSEPRLAAAKNVSQTTIRETLFELESHDLVSRTPRRGTYVTNLTRQDIDERIEVRVPLEALAWKTALPRLGAAELRELRRLAQQLEKASSFQLDYDFHSFLWNLSQNLTLFKILDRLVTPMFALVFLAQGSFQSRKERAESHRTIVGFLEGGDADFQAIQQLVRDHVEGAYRHVRDRYRDARDMALALRASRRSSKK